jgi:putative endonuclease
LSDSRRNILGQRGEDLAARYLQDAGYRIVERNYRNRYGEIDIIAQECSRSALFAVSKILVFVEVKTRRNDRFSHPAEAVTARKQLQISRVALEYLSQNNLTEADARFDVVAILFPDSGTPRIELIRNAFEVSGGF